MNYNSDSLLLGPPELYPKPISPATADSIQSGVENLHHSKKLRVTENNSLTYTAIGNPCLDFFHVLPSTPPDPLIQHLEKAWRYDPLTTLKLVSNLQAVRGTGKSDKQRFYTTTLWLDKNHPKTLARNVGTFAEFGYYKDLLEILYQLIQGEDARKRMKGGSEINNGGRRRRRRRRRIMFFGGQRITEEGSYGKGWLGDLQRKAPSQRLIDSLL